MTAHGVVRDERTVATENASYRWSYLVLSFGLLASTLYRSVVRHEAAWDLLALVVLGGVVATVLQGAGRVLTRRWVAVSAATVVLAACVAALVVLLR